MLQIKLPNRNHTSILWIIHAKLKKPAIMDTSYIAMQLLWTYKIHFSKTPINRIARKSNLLLLIL